MPLITISRTFGSGGSEVAALVAQELGWRLLDNALVDRVAQALGTTRDEVAAREERVSSFVERIASALAFGVPEIAPLVAEGMPPTEERMLEVTRHVIQEAVAGGPAVLVGRGAQALLAERVDGLHVLCATEHEAAVRRVAAREGVSPEEAARRVDDTNRHRQQYVERHFGRQWLAPSSYHLCVNTGRLGIDGAARVVTTLARERFGGG